LENAKNYIRLKLKNAQVAEDGGGDAALSRFEYQESNKSKLCFSLNNTNIQVLEEKL